jgi:hypothetical protein
MWKFLRIKANLTHNFSRYEKTVLGLVILLIDLQKPLLYFHIDFYQNYFDVGKFYAHAETY